ncbi:uncharacterized protein [Pocillopora verrucosa]|uniref:uncharacterized protein n=1 Tax=Pocillopora verrucosa TaxID=203993 RepID=UPI0033401437
MFLIQATLILTSVRTCSLGVCYDKRWDCKDLANDGHCQSNPYATLRECPISCGVHCNQCRDFGWDCEKRKDECHSHPYEAGHHCPKSCGICY